MTVGVALSLFVCFHSFQIRLLDIVRISSTQPEPKPAKAEDATEKTVPVKVQEKKSKKPKSAAESKLNDRWVTLQTLKKAQESVEKQPTPLWSYAQLLGIW